MGLNAKISGADNECLEKSERTRGPEISKSGAYMS